MAITTTKWREQAREGVRTLYRRRVYGLSECARHGCHILRTSKDGRRFLYEYAETNANDTRPPAPFNGYYCGIDCLRRYHNGNLSW